MKYRIFRDGAVKMIIFHKGLPYDRIRDLFGSVMSLVYGCVPVAGQNSGLESSF